MTLRTVAAVLALGLLVLAAAPAPAAATHYCEPGMYCGHGEEVGAVLCLVAEPLPSKLDAVRDILCSWVSG